MMAAAKIETEDVPCCPICLEQFNIPRQLPCAHSFCEKCLQSHITTETTEHKELRYIKCPVCTFSASPPTKDRPTSEWASLFPANTVLESILNMKSKVDRSCDACNTEGASVPAEVICVVCKEYMCGDCLKVHRKLKISKDHTIINTEELACTPENVMKLSEGFTCSEHNGEDIKYYCKDHKIPCCGACFFHNHKICSEVKDLQEELPALLRDSNINDIIADMKKIEIQLHTFMEINESSVSIIAHQVNRLTDQIGDARNKINLVLDELEKRVKTEGNIIYKEEVLRRQDTNRQCLSLMHAVRNSHIQLESVHRYGSHLQTFLMAEKMRLQLRSYCNLVGERYDKTDTITLEVELSPLIQPILSLSFSELGVIVKTVSSNTLPSACLRRPSEHCRIERVDVIDLKDTTGYGTHYYGVAFLPGERVMLADNNQIRCILLSSSYQVITSHKLRTIPHNICALDDQEVALSFPYNQTIQILSVAGDAIVPLRTITFTYRCSGISAAGKGEMVVSGCSRNMKCHWSLLSTGGLVKYSYNYDTTSSVQTYVALNNIKTLVYVTVYDMHSLFCFDMIGRKQFTYSPDNLRGSCGVAVDRYDSIYVLGCLSNNIHQLSPDGSVLQVVSSGMPQAPRAIDIHKSKDTLIITNLSAETKLHIFELKLKKIILV